MDKILIVDSSPQSTDLLAKCLNADIFEIYTSESGLNALAKIRLFQPDLIILGADLPDMSGYDLCKRIKSTQETKFILVLFLCPDEAKESVLRAMEMGADDYMEKQFDNYVLSSKVNSLMRVKHLSDQLKQKYNELQEKNEILDFQLKMGQQIQRALIPDLNFRFGNIRFVSEYMPAMDIGGDFYDVFTLNADCVAVLMGDVSGHGIAAALLTAMLGMMVRNFTQTYMRPDQLLRQMNNAFYQKFEKTQHEMYACIFYAMIDTKAHTIHYANAGQALPMYVDSRNHNAFELEISGLPIGLMQDVTYETHSMAYNEGDMILFHTDGLVDVFYKEVPEEFSSRLKDILLDAGTVDEPKEIISMILNSFYNFNASEAERLELDDISMILCCM